MLIVPISGKIGWKNPPVATLTLILVNCLVFFLLQLNDDQAWMDAEQFYSDSGLAAIEVPQYLKYKTIQGDHHEYMENSDNLSSDQLQEIHFELERDASFLVRLRAEQIIGPKHSQYDEWRQLRRTYEEMRNKSMAFAHGLRPAFPKLSAFFSCMFLHAGFDHLFGNMVFLWILGCMLEVGCGRIFFTVIYIISGLLASVSFWMIYPSSTIPLVGASGAIAGLMGAYTVLYGKTRVTIFYSLGFYFDTTRIPAIILLPIWLANECYQLIFTVSHVAYVAHMGGIIGGASLAFAGDRLWGMANRESFDESPLKKITVLMDQALEHMGNLELDQARSLFEKILELSPDNAEALAYLFNIHKLSPESNDFHEITRRRLRVLLKNGANNPAVIECYNVYEGLASRPILSIPLYLQVAGAMLAEGDHKGAEKIVLGILRHQPSTPGLPSSLIKLSQAYHKNGQLDRWKHYRELVCRKYPDSVEAAIVLRSNAAG